MPSFLLPFLHFTLLDPRLNKLRYGAALAMYAGILVAGSIPGARADLGNYASGVVLHSLAYAALALLWFTASQGSAARRSVATVIAIALMGALDEFVQSFFPYRGPDIRDWLVDCAAAVITCALLSLLLPSVSRQRR